MNLTDSHIDETLSALHEVLRFERPADSVLHAFFRENRALGPPLRAFVAETVFGILRHKRALDYLTQEARGRRLLLAWLIRFAGFNLRQIEPVLRRGEAEWLASIKGRTLDDAPLAVQADLPDWVAEALAPQFADAEILALGRALQQAAPLDLRVNTMRAAREEVLQEFQAGGLDARPTPYSPMGVRVQGRPALNRHALFLHGSVEVQDESSQLLGYVVAPRRHELVVDFCAGAGGKSLMLGAMMNSQGRIYAFDVSSRRLARLSPRLKRSGLSNLHTHLLRSENDIKVKRLAGKIDRVLVDAPCSGLGTLRRNPDLKFRQTATAIPELTAKQQAILRSAATLVKTGGTLVYATCSLLQAENEDVVAAFLADHPQFTLQPCSERLARQHIALDTGEFLRLLPHVHGTDGFFAAVMQRQA